MEGTFWGQKGPKRKKVAYLEKKIAKTLDKGNITPYLCSVKQLKPGRQ